MMDIEQIKETILTNLYLAFFNLGGESNLPTLSEKFELNGVHLDHLLEQMVDDDLIKPWTAGGNYRITPQGVIMSEAQGFLPKNEVAENNRIRTTVLISLAELYESQGRHQSIYIEQFKNDIQCDSECLAWNLYVLEEFGYIESPYNGSFRISNSGVALVDKYRKGIAIEEEFKPIAALEPHKRGRAFQSYVAKLLLRDGWEVEESVRTISEEMDIMIHKGREYYLIECKWEKDPIQAPVIRELFGKIENRIGVEGLIVSMSGFTEGAVDQVKSYANKRIILLFGPKDVEDLSSKTGIFDNLLGEKFRDLVSRQIVHCR
jgi:hypothetical protein